MAEPGNHRLWYGVVADYGDFWDVVAKSIDLRLANAMAYALGFELQVNAFGLE